MSVDLIVGGDEVQDSEEAERAIRPVDEVGVS